MIISSIAGYRLVQRFVNCFFDIIVVDNGGKSPSNYDTPRSDVALPPKTFHNKNNQDTIYVHVNDLCKNL